jgi:hypothetical protein
MLSSSTLQLIECGFSTDKHISKHPVTLSCGHCVCKECTLGDSIVTCIHCGQVNKLDLKENKESAIKFLINDCLDQLFDLLDHRFRKAFRHLFESENIFKEFLNNRVEFVKTEIEIRVESLKIELDNFLDELNKDLEYLKDEIMENREEFFKKNEEEINYKSKYDQFGALHDQEKTLNTFYDYQQTLIDMNKLVKENLSMKNFELNFDYSDFKLEKNIIGKFNLKMQTFSKILTQKQFKDLLEISEFNTKNELKLIYCGSKDGFNSKDFHKKCDCIENTLTIIKTSDNYIFGGFTSKNWNPKEQNGNFKYDDKAFLFSFKNKIEKPIKLPIVEPDKAIICHESYGPIFGSGNDICIANNCDQNSSSYSYISSYYATELIKNNRNILSGSTNFNCIEVEIFQV